MFGELLPGKYKSVRIQDSKILILAVKYICICLDFPLVSPSFLYIDAHLSPISRWSDLMSLLWSGQTDGPIDPFGLSWRTFFVTPNEKLAQTVT